MPADPIRLLAIGDIHLGRRSGRLPAELDAARLDPAAALERAVQLARRHQVRAVLLAGDVVDSDHNVFHALGLLAGAVNELTQHGIAVYAVAGNHDAAVLPLAGEALRELRILGRDGRWEEVVIDDAVRLRGWSFPGPRHPASPLAGFPPVEGGPPVIGLLHADLGARASAYAPVTPGDLASAGPVRWLLGHLHQPTLRPDDTAPGYLGSLVGLDPTETGPHGPWLVTVKDDAVTLEHLAEAPLHWTTADLTVEDLADPVSELPALVTDTLRELAGREVPGLAAAEAVGVRLRLVGRTPDLAGLEEARRQLQEAGLTLPVQQRTVFLDQVTSELRSMHDLAALAEADDLPGLLARDLLALERGEAAPLLEEAMSQVTTVDHQSYLGSIRDVNDTPDEDALRRMLLQSGYQLLDLLLARTGGADGAP